MRAVSRVALVLLLVGCVANGELKNPGDMQPKEKAAFVLMLYNNADTNYRAQFESTALPMSESTKAYFRAYKRMLEGAAPVVRLYVDTVIMGARPTMEQEEEMIRLIYSLQTTLSGGKDASR